MKYHFDHIVVGGGLAGLCTAHYLSLREGTTTALMVTSELTDSNSYHAQGGMAAVWSDDDTTHEHYEDTMVAGAFLNDPTAVTVLTDEAPMRIEELIDLGMKFDSIDGKISLGLEGGHHHHRILHAGGDATGQKVTSFLISVVEEDPGITVLDHHALFELIRDKRSSRVVGVRYFDTKTGAQDTLLASTVVLATGGYAALFSRNTNPPFARGDGLIAAYRAGATLRDLEFVQFHPTALDVPHLPAFLISEAVRGEGAYLLNKSDERFMLGRHPLSELAPRDIVAREIFKEIREGGAGSIRLSLKHLDPDRVRGRFPSIYTYLNSHNIDMTSEIPVAPAAHYSMGGVLVDLFGRTSIPGLYAVGEVASSGVMGANRLASNSLVECTVFSKRIAEAVAHDSSAHRDSPSVPESYPGVTISATREEDEISSRLGQVLTNNVGIIRDEDGLNEALTFVRDALRRSPTGKTSIDYFLEGRLRLAELIILSALSREESRGSHYRSDFPTSLPVGEMYHTLVQKDTPIQHIPVL